MRRFSRDLLPLILFAALALACAAPKLISPAAEPLVLQIDNQNWWTRAVEAQCDSGELIARIRVLPYGLSTHTLRLPRSCLNLSLAVELRPERLRRFGPVPISPGDTILLLIPPQAALSRHF